MRIFLVLLIATAAFVVALLLGAILSSGRLGGALRTGRWNAWLAGLFLPALALELGCWRYAAQLNAAPRGWVAPVEGRVATVLLLTSGLIYAAGYLLGGLPPKQSATRARTGGAGGPETDVPAE